MAKKIEKMRETTDRDGNVSRSKIITHENNGHIEADHRQNVLARAIWFVAGVIIVLLAFRFVLSLLGANRGNGFASFIYDSSHPFVAPFFSLFNYNFSYGSSRFEIYTLVAIAVYAIVAWGLAYLTTVNHYHSTTA